LRAYDERPEDNAGFPWDSDSRVARGTEEDAESSRPSLRALARELGTSHQLLSDYLKRLDKWQRKEYSRRAEEIRKRAATENRNMTPWEESQVCRLERAAFDCMIDSVLGDTLKQIERDAKAGLLQFDGPSLN
jgi:hypothetical protein